MKLIPISGTQNQHLYRRPGSEIIYVQKFLAGKGRLERSTGTAVLRAARVKRDELLAEFLGIKKYTGKRLLVEDKFVEFLEIKAGKAKATHASIKNQWVNHLSSYFGGMLLDEVTDTAWLKYVNLKRVTHPDRRFFNDRKYLSMFLHWLHRDGHIEKLPRLTLVDPERAAGKVYTPDELASLLNFAEPDLYLQILMAVTMGMRISEIMNLSWDRVNLTSRIISLRAQDTKTRKARTFGISDQVLDILKVRSKREETFVFPSPTDPTRPQGRQGNKSAWDTCRYRSGVSGRFHDLRHTFLTYAFKNSVNPALICHFAGLSLEEAQKTYLHFSVEDTRAVAGLVKVVG